ncbi:MAG: 1-deoxy-D-xylulose-5-phosphate reductoisomerase [Bacteroidales bacterium]|nr:1-deoxy-D-xylulose-5-phosphate reductoisomerase [Bacteroidales bacterium]
MDASEHKRRIALLGSTGSMGVQSLEVIAEHSDLLQLEVIAANSSADLLIQQARTYKPNIVVVVQEAAWRKVKDALQDEDIKVFCGEQSLCDVCEMECVDMVLSCIVGVAGLRPVWHAIEAGKQIALANKETLVVAGELMTRRAAENRVPLLPVDSEHSAIFQCLAGEQYNEIEKLLITASGGPFRGRRREDLAEVTVQQALKHPNWSMGPKITIDSATLMNKGLEVIEAKWLFNVPLEKIEVVVHPQSVIHSMVQFTDGSVKAQLGIPSMKLPIQYALTYPFRQSNKQPRLSFADYPSLTFEKPDLEVFPCLGIAYECSKKGGNLPCVMNAANEVAVAWFLQGRIKFLEIAEIIRRTVESATYCVPQSVDEYLQIDREVREKLQNDYR